MGKVGTRMAEGALGWGKEETEIIVWRLVYIHLMRDGNGRIHRCS